MIRVGFILAAILVLVLAATRVLWVQIGAPKFSVEPGWYRWANLSDNPRKYVPPPQMMPFDVTHRCLCAKGFVAVKDDPHSFRIVTAPAGYSDTVGQYFIDKPSSELTELRRALNF